MTPSHFLSAPPRLRAHNGITWRREDAEGEANMSFRLPFVIPAKAGTHSASFFDVEPGGQMGSRFRGNDGNGQVQGDERLKG